MTIVCFDQYPVEIDERFLQQMIRQRHRERTLECLQAHGGCATGAELVAATRLPVVTVDRALAGLIADGRVRTAASMQGPMYCITTVGRCDWCGLVDHHLVEGACPRCSYPTISESRPAARALETTKGATS
ncbi:hypothetical protein [Marinobacter subterrani]|uniref:Uncharacterized protein n=1 Tax=Marinobacter subterrani TaxID=1658765 RepID=A0A0J7JC11_9GAMM|nr:hypothetical protein [Marinobacter subterrani]KMQ73761.1 hypothetical protein Msub_20982 [Marinobacter subterrani]KMQ75356.1 hypothetical protein Msub_11558 [Marinobacter subterrani]KMQ76990.1 hypothetical protein Msub_13205 [Marinobacter subterrani]